jgi:Flp pilus assembly protein TadB
MWNNPRPTSLLEAFWKLRVAAGVTLLAAGLLVAIYPQLLVLMVAATVAGTGLTLIGSGLRARRRLRGTRPSAPKFDHLWR